MGREGSRANQISGTGPEAIGGAVGGSRVNQINGNRTGSAGNRLNRSGPVPKSVGFLTLTEPSKCVPSVYHSVRPIYHSGFSILKTVVSPFFNYEEEVDLHKEKRETKKKKIMDISTNFK